jgi:hypothetical protein
MTNELKYVDSRLKNRKFISPKQTPETMWICSIDVGKKNFAWYVEEVYYQDLQSIEDLDNRYNPNGIPTPAMKNIIDQVCMNGKTILHTNSDITQNCVKGKYLDPESFHNLTDLLDNYGDYWDKCSYFIIEQQMAFRGVYNTMALKLGQHCYSYFNFRYGRFKQVIEFPAYYKTTVLGAEKIKGKPYKNGKTRWKTIDKPTRKKWAIAKASEILKNRDENDTISNIRTRKKKDDLADTFVQCQAWKILHFVHKKYNGSV